MTTLGGRHLLLFGGRFRGFSPIHGGVPERSEGEGVAFPTRPDFGGDSPRPSKLGRTPLALTSFERSPHGGTHPCGYHRRMLQAGEILIILLLALVLLGPKRLPETARKMGQWVGEVRRAARELTEGIETEIAEAMQPFDDVRRDMTDTLSTVDPQRYEWTGPAPSTGPTPDDALSDLEKIEETPEEPK